jgi:hypothetical protein
LDFLENLNMRNLYLILVVAISLLPFTPVNAAPADLPETGQTSCSDADGTTIPCASTGQDGDHKAGVAWPNPRFTAGTGDTADCVTDKFTGLMWVGTPDPNQVTWTNALAFANDLTLCGFDDWRLPNINELESLTNIETADLAAFLNTQGFSGFVGNAYWSSTTNAEVPARAWAVFMTHSNVFFHPKTQFMHFWPVRTGQ